MGSDDRIRKTKSSKNQILEKLRASEGVKELSKTVDNLGDAVELIKKIEKII